jgi:PQQ enzyme repeat
MRHFALRLFYPAVLCLSACSLYFERDPDVPPACDPSATCDDGGEGDDDEREPTVPPATFTFSKVRAIAGEYPVVGVDSDGAGGLWLAYRLALGGYYDLDDVRVVHLDGDGRKLSEWRYLDEYTPVTGIAFGAGAVWLNYGAVGAGNNHVRKLDPVDGHRLSSFAMEPGIVDLDVRGDELLLSNLWNQVVALDVRTGGERWRTELTSFVNSTQRGIASTADGDLWVATAVSDRILLLDAEHRVVDVGVTDQLDPQWNGSEGLLLAWDGSSLILARGSQISWLARPGRARY